MVTSYPAPRTQTELLSENRLHTLYQIIQRMNSVYELPDLLAFILDRALEDTGGRRGYLLLAGEQAADGSTARPGSATRAREPRAEPRPERDEGRGEGQDEARDEALAAGSSQPSLQVKAARGDGVDLPQAEADILGLVSRTVVRDVLQRGEPRVIEDLRQDVRFKSRTSHPSSQLKWQSILAVPLKVTDRLIGLMYIEHPGRNAFANPDLEFLAAFAGQAAAAIERAQQGQRRIQELERLNEVSRSVVRVLDLDQVLIHILREATHMLDVETGSVLLLDAGSDELIFRISVQEGRTIHISQHLKVGQGVAGWVAQHGQPLLVPDVSQDPRWYGEVEDSFATRSILCVPLMIDDHVIGVLQALNKKGPLGFTQRDLALLSTFAISATVAIENARLFAEVRQVDELRTLNQVGSALTASLDVQRVLNIIMEGLTALIHVERVSIFLINQLTGELVLEYSLGGHEDIRLRAPWPGIVGWIALHGVPVIANDVRHDPRFLPDIDAATQFATRSILGTPLMLDERVIGVVEMLNKLDGSFTPRDRDRLVDFSKWAAIALFNARLYQELEEAKERLANAEAVAVIGDMALNLTHELNNRISIVPLTISRIQAKCKAELDNPYLEQKLDVIGRVMEESKTIIRRIREPFEVADERPVSVTDCLAEALNSSPLKPGIKVVERYQPDLPPVIAAREKLVQAFRHIISNALEAMGEQGQLWLSTRRRTDGLVETVISDDGPGILPEIRKDIFKIGISTKKDRGGLGLGLWWTHAYVSRLGGQIKLHSTPDGGTVVSIRLPPAA
jgi:GAF domain-containing protein